MAKQLFVRFVSFLKRHHVTVRARRFSWLAVLSVIMACLLSCGILSALVPSSDDVAEEPGRVGDVEATDTAEPTRPMRAPELSATPVPSDTPVPTDTPAPTSTPTETETPRPTSTRTPRPTMTATAVPDAVVTGETLNMRSGPDTAYQVVAVLNQGDELVITGVNAERTWIRVTVAGQMGWVFAAMCEVNEDLNHVTVIEVAAPTAAPLPTSPPVPTELPAPTSAPVQPTSPPAPTAVPRDYVAAGVWRCPDTMAGAAYVGSINSDKFHSLGCRYVGSIHAENRICFESREAAVNFGKEPCGTCNP